MPTKFAAKDIYEQFTNILKDKNGCNYAEIVEKEGLEFERLMNGGAIADKYGRRIPAKRCNTKEEREKFFGELFASGDPVYVYKQGEQYPCKVQLDMDTGKLKMSDKPLTPQSEIRKPEEPGFFAKYADVIARMFGGRVESCKKWDAYQAELAAKKNVQDPRRMQRRIDFDPVLKDKVVFGKVDNPAETEVEKALKQQLKEAREEIERMKKQISDLGNSKQDSPDVSKKKDVEVKGQVLDQTQLEQVKHQKNVDQVQKAVEVHNPTHTQPADKVKAAGEDKKKDKEAAEEKVQAEKEKKSEAAASVKQTEKTNEHLQKQDMINSKEELLDRLKALNGGQELPKLLVDNVNRMAENAESGKAKIESALADPEKKIIAAGNAVSDIAVYETMKTIAAAGDQELIGTLNRENAVNEWRQISKLSPKVSYAGTFAHERSFYEKNVLGEENGKKLADDVLTSITNKLEKDKGAAKEKNLAPEMQKNLQKGKPPVQLNAHKPQIQPSALV